MKDVGDAVAGAAAALLMLVILFLMAVLIAALVALALEAIRVYKERCCENTETARWLWLALGVFLILLATAGLLVGVGVASVGLGLASWAFFGWVIAIEWLDIGERRRQRLALESVQYR